MTFTSTHEVVIVITLLSGSNGMDNGSKPSGFRLIHPIAHFEVEWAPLGNVDGPKSASTAYDLSRLPLIDAKQVG